MQSGSRAQVHSPGATLSPYNKEHDGGQTLPPPLREKAPGTDNIHRPGQLQTQKEQLMATREIREDFQVEVAFGRMVKEMSRIAVGEDGEREPRSGDSVLLMGQEHSATC